MTKLFGTDGIRGVAGIFPLTLGDAYRLGRAAGSVLIDKFPAVSHRVLIVRDTRISGEGLSKGLSKGLLESGIDVYDGGVLNTPSVAYLVRAHRFQSGVVISASHNPPEFNGIKFFTDHGTKWPDIWEEEVEKRFHHRKFHPSRFNGTTLEGSALADDYQEFLLKTLPPETSFAGMRLAIDCSHGANHRVAPEIFRQLGAKISVMGVHPNGRNINVACGSQHTESLAEMVRRNQCQLGIAFDGDGDRVIFVDEKGQAKDGDYILAILAKDLKKQGLLKHHTAVITVMANLGLKKALKKLGVRTVETPVGDRHVSEAMKEHGAVLGGEQSGHIILGRHLPSGDGLLTALHVVCVWQKSQIPFSRLTRLVRKFPQVLWNVRVRGKKPLAKLSGVQKAIRKVEKHLGKNGRVLVRYSGTEPLLRIMLEGPKKSELESLAASIKAEALTALGQ